MNNPAKFTIVVFAKNEEDNITFVLDELLQSFTSDKIIFVLDGDIDVQASLLFEKNIRHITGPNSGKGAAIRAAINDIHSEILVFMDADGSHQPQEIEHLLSVFSDDQVKMVIGSRFLGNSEELYDCMLNRVRLVGNVLGNLIINTLWNRTCHHISDAQNGFRGIRREAFLTLDLKENRFSIEQEMVIKCLKKGYRICEVPSFERKRIFGRSHISAKCLFDYMGCMIRNINN